MRREKVSNRRKNIDAKDKSKHRRKIYSNSNNFYHALSMVIKGRGMCLQNLYRSGDYNDGDHFR